MTTDESAEAAHTFDALNIRYFVFYCSSVLVLPSYTLLARIHIANITICITIIIRIYNIISYNMYTYNIFNCLFRYTLIFHVNHCDFEKKCSWTLKFYVKTKYEHFYYFQSITYSENNIRQYNIRSYSTYT